MDDRTAGHLSEYRQAACEAARRAAAVLEEWRGRFQVREKGRADLLTDAHVIVPVPLSRFRLFWRRFNQAALLASELARCTGLDYAPAGLARVRETA